MKEAIDIEEWACADKTKPIPEADSFRVRLWDGDGFDEKRTVTLHQPTARQILETFERFPADEYVLLYLPRAGKLETIDLDETIDLREQGPERFFAFKTDRLLNFMANGRRFAWGANKIPVELVRLVAGIPDNETLYLEQTDVADKELTEGDMVRLGGKGLERLSSRAQSWKLNVQGVLLTLTTPLIAVKDALAQAGFDPNADWIAILKRKGEAKLQVALTDEIDLRLPGIEKLRLTPGQINNGEAHSAPRSGFQLLDKDETYLQQRGLTWETFEEGGRRWLVLRNFILPEGYSCELVDSASEIIG